MPDFLIPGFNGLGGVTLEGKVQNYRIRRNIQRLTLSANYQDLTNTGKYYNVKVILAGDSEVSAAISGRLTWKGRLVPLNKSTTYLGRNDLGDLEDFVIDLEY